MRISVPFYSGIGARTDRKHVFDRKCTEKGIDHRLIRSRRPQTNGMVERFNGRIGEVVRQTEFVSSSQVKETLLRYLLIYNHHIPQKNLGHITPVEALKNWRKTHPYLFKKPVYNPISRGLTNMKKESDNIAIFLDVENLTEWIKKKGPEHLLGEINPLGRTIVRRAYGNWTANSILTFQAYLNRLGFELVHTYHPVSGKNSSDIQMTVDVIEYA